MVHSPVLGLSLEELRSSQPAIPVSLWQVNTVVSVIFLGIYTFSLSPDLRDPVVIISSTSVGTLAVGESLELTCSMTVEEHLTPSAELSIEWSGGSVSGSGVTENDTRAVNETTSERTLIFNSLNTSHGGQYTCQAVIYIDLIRVMKTGMDSAEVMVQSEYLSLTLVVVDHVCLCPSVPKPVVVVTASERELVSGSPLSLSCSILPPFVDTSITISSHWTTPGGRYDTDNTSLLISSVETADSGNYTCSAIASDSSGSQYVVDSEDTDTASILVSKWRLKFSNSHFILTVCVMSSTECDS